MSGTTQKTDEEILNLNPFSIFVQLQIKNIYQVVHWARRGFERRNENFPESSLKPKIVGYYYFQASDV